MIKINFVFWLWVVIVCGLALWLFVFNQPEVNNYVPVENFTSYEFVGLYKELDSNGSLSNDTFVLENGSFIVVSAYGVG